MARLACAHERSLVTPSVPLPPAARIDGCGRLGAFLRVTLPCLRRGWARPASPYAVLAFDHDLHAPVVGAPLRGLVVGDGPIGPQPYRADPTGLDALGDQVVAHRLRAPARQLLVPARRSDG